MVNSKKLLIKYMKCKIVISVSARRKTFNKLESKKNGNEQIFLQNYVFEILFIIMLKISIIKL